MANPEHLEILRQGAVRWNQWRKGHSDERPDLSGAKLGNAELGGANLSGATLRWATLEKANAGGANLQNADLSGANFGRSNLREADLSEADLRDANLCEADLTGANLSCANLSEEYQGVPLPGGERALATRGANLCRANLRGVDLTGTNLRDTELSETNFSAARTRGTIFAGVDLSVANGLETITHLGPSTVGIDTIYQSRGKIPEVFLRGCGVPDDMISYIKSIAGAIHFYSCFISYSTKDQEFADRLYADLQNKGVRCWFAPHDIQGGRKLHEQLNEAIRLHDKLLLILSEHSMNSNWVQTEIANARKREEREKKQMLFPITLAPYEDIRQWKLFDADRGIDSAREIREYFIPEFSNWKDHDSYQMAFQRLVKDLKAESRSAAG